MMESVTMNRQSVEVLRAMAARVYGDPEVPDGDGWTEELGHGWFNVAYRGRCSPPSSRTCSAMGSGAMSTLAGTTTSSVGC
jgi:hypothetical protein